MTVKTRPIEGKFRALCCVCGDLRYVSKNASLKGRRGEWNFDDPDPSRMMADLKCVHCAEVTRHALLRDFDPSADNAEHADEERLAYLADRAKWDRDGGHPA